MTLSSRARFALMAFLVMCVFGLGGCAVVEGIFKFGVVVGVLAVLAAVAVIGGIVAMVTRK